MRLIDADNALNDIDDLLDGYARFIKQEIKACFTSLIDKQPTIEPVKRGEWVYVDKCHIQEWQAINKCSVCGHSVCNVSYVDKVVHFNYCPHCGSYMRGEIDG